MLKLRTLGKILQRAEALKWKITEKEKKRKSP